MKRLIFCFDGTWNKIDAANPTNVARIAQSVTGKAGETSQIVHYDEGVGTSFLERKLGGATGYGLSGNVAEAYHFLVLNYEPGDEIFAFGFSRGAFTARSFVGLIRNCGVISRRQLDKIAEAIALYRSRSPDAHPGSDRMRTFRFETRKDLCLPGDRDWRLKTRGFGEKATDLTVRYVGVWDTVASLGVPPQVRWLAPFVNRKYRFHDARLSKVVEAARHAVAADEQRKTFSPSLWSNLDDLDGGDENDPLYQQMIFPGPHGAVGGGGDVKGLSDGALAWVLRGALKQGLMFDLDAGSPLYGLRPDHRHQLFNERGKMAWSFGDRMMGLGLAHRSFSEVDVRAIHPSLLRRYKEAAESLPEKAEYRPPALKLLHNAIESQLRKLQQDFDAMKGDPPEGSELVEVRSYTVQAGDKLEHIARDQMGDAKDWPILFKHNRRNGILFDPNELWVGETIEVPIYRDPIEVKSMADGDAPSTPPPRCSL